MEEPNGEAVRVLIYEEQIFARQMGAMFFVHPRLGLIRGGYAAPFQGAADCAVAMRLLDNVVSRRYPTLRPRERGVGDTDDACAQAVAGQGGYAKGWEDPANGARIMLMLLPGASEVLLTYTTPEGDAWERRKNDARF